MAPSWYEPAKLLKRAAEWRIEAERATLPSMRAFCLQEAERYEEIVRRSLEIQPLKDDAAA